MGDGIEEGGGNLANKLRENKKSDVKVGADECFLIVTFIFQTILNLVVVHLRYCGLRRRTSCMNMLKKGRP